MIKKEKRHKLLISQMKEGILLQILHMNNKGILQTTRKYCKHKFDNFNEMD